MPQSHTRIITLSDDQCRDLLKTHKTRLGRVAFAEGGQAAWPSILPVNYTYWDGSIFFRTLEGSKLYTALRRQRVAFEIDEIQDEWQQGWSLSPTQPSNLSGSTSSSSPAVMSSARCVATKNRNDSRGTVGRRGPLWSRYRVRSRRRSPCPRTSADREPTSTRRCRSPRAVSARGRRTPRSA